MTCHFVFTRAVAVSAAMAAAGAVLAADPVPAARAPVTDLSTRSATSAVNPPAAPPAISAAEVAAVRKALADLTIEIDQLRGDLREARGQIEVQTHELEALKNRNREALADADKRLRELERRSAPSSTAAGTGADSTATAAPAVGGAPISAGEQQTYDAAFNLMKQGYYEKAGKGFRELINQYPSSELAGNAQYWIGETQYVTRNFRQALEEFTKVVEKYPASAKVPDAWLKIGYCQQELGALDKAKTILQQVIGRYPNTTVSKSAEQRLAAIKTAEAAKPKAAADNKGGKK